MKRIFLFSFIISFAITINAYSGISIGGFGGYNLYLDDVIGPSADTEQTVDEIKNRLAGGVKIGYSLPVLTVGILVEYLPLYNMSLLFYIWKNLTDKIKIIDCSSLHSRKWRK